MKVAVGVIYDPLHGILITQRAAHASSGGLWEFPGGKLEKNETPEAALIREVKEEVNLEVRRCDFITQIDAQRPDGLLSLYVFWVHDFTGQAIRLESQANLLWAPPKTLQKYQFPPTNSHILTWINQKFL